MTIWEGKQYLKQGRILYLDNLGCWRRRVFLNCYHQLMLEYLPNPNKNDWTSEYFPVDDSILFSDKWELDREYVDFTTALNDYLRNKSCYVCEDTNLYLFGDIEYVTFTSRDLHSKRWYRKEIK